MFKRLFKGLNVFWPGKRTDCAKLTASCPDCILYNVPRTGLQPLKPELSYLPFDSVSMTLLVHSLRLLMVLITSPLL